MLDQRGRPKWAAVTDPVTAVLLKTKISPTGLTVVGLAITLAGAGLVAAGVLVWGALLAGIGSLLDTFDGPLARARGDDNRHGAFVDTISDRFGEIGLFAATAWYVIDDPLGVMLTLTATVMALMVPYVRAKAEALGGEGAGGIMGRAERVLVLVLGVGLEGFGLPTLYPALWALAGLTAITVAIRIWRAWFQLTAE